MADRERQPGERGLRWAVVIVCVAILVLMGIARADHDWFHGTRNAAGELCCGENDCLEINAREIAHRGGFYFLFLDGSTLPEVIPESEVQLSRDGRYWRCHRSDGSRRCFFAPPPTT